MNESNFYYEDDTCIHCDYTVNYYDEVKEEATKLEISSDTLVKYYKKELDDGRIDANASIGQTLFQQAKNGNTAAAIFWLKTRARWKETHAVEHSGPEGSELVIKWQS